MEDPAPLSYPPTRAGSETVGPHWLLAPAFAGTERVVLGPPPPLNIPPPPDPDDDFIGFRVAK
jgi:hypothetical protein